MTLLDGLYRHRGTSWVWDDLGLTVTTSGDGAVSHVEWTTIDGVRHLGVRPGFVQLIVRGHVPPADLDLDPFSIPVASDADANRLVSAIGWRLTPQPPNIWGPPVRRERL